MDYVWYLFRFDGRINRARCWLALLIVICWMIFLSLVLFGGAHLFGATMPKQFDVGPNRVFDFIDPAAWRSLTANTTALFVQMVETPLFLWVYLATSVKRLHDRNKSGWWLLLFFALPGLYSQFGDRVDHWLGNWATMVFGLNAPGYQGTQPIRCRPAGADRHAARLGPAVRDRNGPEQSQCRLAEDCFPARRLLFATFGKQWALADSLQIGGTSPAPVWRVKPGHE
jgi:uncharacterized membrane protein YhaH (DUF805 family)